MPRAWSRITAPWSISITRRRMLSTIAGVVGRHHDRGPGAIDPVEQRHDALARRRVEVAGRLVGEDDERAVHESPGDGHALLLAARQLIGQPVALLAEADQFEHLRHLRRDHVAGPPDDLEGEGDVLEHGLVRQQAEVLEDATEIAPQIRHSPVRELADLLACHPDLAAVGNLLAQQELEHRGLARSRGPDEEDELALQDLERDIPQGDDGALVGLRDVLEADHRSSSPPTSGTNLSRRQATSRACYKGVTPPAALRNPHVPCEISGTRS